MSAITITMPDGRTWTPKFVKEISQEKCIGCGRCFKVCGRDVLQLVGIDDEGEVVAIQEDEDDEYEKKVMTIANQMNCVGCEACSKICPKKCYTHEAMSE
ncbi:MAG: ferredoxin III, nif-specific [Burkholderiales bacterium]|nr:ferredoxin III, nif-specific [Burkholderiales bacterium]